MIKIHSKQNIIFLVNKWDNADLKHFNDSKAFIEYANDMDDIYQNIEEYIPNKKGKALIFFDDIIVDMLTSKKLNSIVTKLFIRDRKLNISFVFVPQPYFTVSKNIWPNSISSWKTETLFSCSKKYLTKFYTLFHHENCKQTRTLTNFI